MSLTPVDVVVRPALPRPRGPLTAHLFEHLTAGPHELPPLPAATDDALTGDDFQLALYCCYELHYRGFAGVDDGWEWEPSLLAARRDLEGEFEHRLAEDVAFGGQPDDLDLDADDLDPDLVVPALRDIVENAAGPSLSRHMLGRGTLAQFREFAVHRSAYQLKEADPHTWAIPRLAGGPKAALVAIQYDEYGRGVDSEMHATLFATTMERLGLSPDYGAYLHLLPGATLATCNLVSLFGLHRRWRGALVGHLAVFESTSVRPMGRYARALRRLGVAVDSERFYDVHVAADAGHEAVALKDLAAGLAAAEPGLAPDILFGARALMAVEGRFAARLLGSWAAGRSSLLVPSA